MTLSLSQPQVQQLIDHTSSDTNNYPQGYQDISQFIADGNSNGGISSATAFWYEQAAKINDPTLTSASKNYIHNVTQNGWLLDGQSPHDLQEVSDAIAHRVIGDTIRDATVADISDLVTNDIGIALRDYNVTPGGWGGSFYYWNEQYNGSSIGSQILNTPEDGYDHGEEAKFIAANGAALASSLTNDTFEAFKNAVEYLGFRGAELPFAEALKVKDRAFDLMKYGGSIAGDPDQIGNFSYVPTSDQWVTSSSSFSYEYQAPALPATGSVASELSAHRQWILDRSGVTYNSSPDSSLNTKHTDAIINQDQSGYVIAGNDSGMEQGIAGQTAVGAPFDTTVYNDYYDSDDNRLATSRYYLSNGSTDADLGGASVQANEDIVYSQSSQPDQGTLILDKITINGDSQSGLYQDSATSSDTWASWQVVNDSSLGPESSQFYVTNKDGTSFRTIWNDPSTPIGAIQWQQIQYDVNGSTVSVHDHYAPPQQDPSGFTFSDITYITGASATYITEWAPGDPGTPPMLTASGFDGSSASAHELWQTRTANLQEPLIA